MCALSLREGKGAYEVCSLLKWYLTLDGTKSGDRTSWCIGYIKNKEYVREIPVNAGRETLLPPQE